MANKALFFLNLIADMSLQRRVSAILDSSSLTVAKNLTNPDQHTVVLIDPKTCTKELCAAIKAGADVQVVMVMNGQNCIEENLIESFLSTQLSHIVNLETHYETRELLTTLMKIKSHDVFGLEKYLTWGTPIEKINISNSEEKSEALLSLVEKIRESKGRRSMIARIESVADELAMNAIYDAPETVGSLEGQGELEFGCDGYYFGVAVRDGFGTLRKENVAGNILRVFKEGVTPRTSGKSGAGLGLYFVFRLASHLIINVNPGVCTEVIALFRLSESRRKASATPESMQFFSASEIKQ